MAKKDFEGIEKLVFNATEERNKRLRKSYQDIIPELRAFYASLSDRTTFADLNKFGGAQLRSAYEEVKAVAGSVYASQIREIEEDLRGVYTLAFDESKSALQKTTGSAVAGALRVGVLEQALKTPVGGLTIDLRFERLQQDLTTKIFQQVVLGLQNGESLTTVSSKLRNAAGGNLTGLQRIVRTEGHRLQTRASLDAAGNSSVPLNKTWNTQGDSRVRRDHVELDGVTIPLEDDFTSPSGAVGPGPGLMGSPEDDINDRCYLSYSPREEK